MKVHLSTPIGKWKQVSVGNLFQKRRLISAHLYGHIMAWGSVQNYWRMCAIPCTYGFPETVILAELWMRSSLVVEELQPSGYSVWLPMPKCHQFWVRSPHLPTKWNLRDGRWSSESIALTVRQSNLSARYHLQLPTWTANLANSLVVAKDGKHQAAIRLRLQSSRVLKYKKIHGPSS
jgi:hypothetical protein